MTTDSISLEFLATQAKQNMEELRMIRSLLTEVGKDVVGSRNEMTDFRDEMAEFRKDFAATRATVNDMLRLVNATYDYSRRAERRHVELREDIELIIKMEMGGTLANIQTTFENRFSLIEERVSALEHKI